MVAGAERTSRHAKGLKYLEDVLGPEIARKEYLSSMFVKDASRGSLSAKITHKVLERFLSVVEKIKFTVELYDAILGDTMTMDGVHHTTLKEKLHAAQLDSQEYADFADYIEQAFQYNLDAQHQNFISKSLQCFN